MTKKIINYILIFICILPGVVSVLVNVYFVNNLAIDGKKLQEAIEESEFIERENAMLNLEKSKLGTTYVISEKAQKLGMKPGVISFFTKDTFAYDGR